MTIPPRIFFLRIFGALFTPGVIPLPLLIYALLESKIFGNNMRCFARFGTICAI